MIRARAALPSVLLLGAAVAGCNLVFGITGGLTGGSAGSAGSTTTGPGSSSTGSASSTSSSSTSSSGGTGGSAPSVAVVPMAATQLARTTVVFSATVTGPNPAVTWSITEASGGTIDPQSGAYTAPATAGTFHVVATSVADPTRSGQATVDVKQGTTPTILLSTGALATATGHGSQTHLVRTQGTGEWWLFHDPAGQSALSTRYSADFTSWHDGPSLAVANSQDGRDLSVAYRSIKGQDVIHLTQGFHTSTYGRYHIRATASGGGKLSYGTPWTVNDGGDTTPDGASTTILASGLVIDSTGWQGTPATPPLNPCGSGDLDIYTSGVLDDGSATLDDMKFTKQVPKVLWCVGDHILARQLLPLGDVAIHVCVDGESGLAPQTLYVNARTAAGQWNPSDTMGGPIKPNLAFPAPLTFGIDDWSAAVLNGQVHVVRRIAGSNGFEHAVVNSAGVASPGGTVVPTPTTAGSGLFLGAYGDGLVLAALDANAAGNVIYTAFDGKHWSGWATLVTIGATGSYLAGFAPEGAGRPAVIWTQAAGTSYAIAGALLP